VLSESGFPCTTADESTPPLEISEDAIDELLRLLAGEAAPAALVTLLCTRTRGRRRAVIELLHAAAQHEAPLVDALWELLATGEQGRPPAIFRREGEYWTIHYAGAVARLRHTRGLEYLASMLWQPGHRFHAMDLTRRGPRASPVVAERARLAVTKGLAAAIARIERAIPELGRHLRATVHRGYRCAYLPDPERAIRWRR
jgi:hypothetical protein